MLIKDKKGGLARTHKKSLEVVKDLRESLDLIDAWRVLHSDLLNLRGVREGLKFTVDLIFSS